MTKVEKLKNLQDEWDKKNICELKKTATQAVYGNGNPSANIVFIGEAPGKQEDLEGVPFIGAAGKFLNEMLADIGMKRDDIYITNAVKYRPPNNRDPFPEEKAACRGWLLEELSFIKPKLIVFLGRHALGNFFPEEKISVVHGKLLIKIIPELGKQYFLTLYHPAAALYNGGMRETLTKDFKKITLALKKIKKELQ